MMILIVVGVIAALVALWYVQDIWRALKTPRLAPSPGLPRDGPLVSVLVPARDEAARIGACLDGLARQSYSCFEVIVVDDHSTDGTAEVTRSYAGKLPALKVLPGAELPPGWSGKCWACWQAAAAAQGEWLLFLDADVAPAPELLAALVERGETNRLDMISLLPLVQLGSLGERLLLPAFINLVSIMYPFQQVYNPRSPLAFAIGQCIFVRRSVYTAVDGHRAVRGSILEDMELGQRIKRAGWRLEADEAPDLIAVRMYDGWGSAAQGLGKNAVAGYRNGGRRSTWAGTRLLIQAIAPWYMLLIGLALIWTHHVAVGQLLVVIGVLLATIALSTWGWLLQRRHRESALWCWLLPLGVLLYFGVAAWGLVRLRSGQGVGWKGRVFYD